MSRAALLGILLAFGLPLAAQPGPAAGAVAVYVDGLCDTGGDLVVRLYRSPQGFPASRRRAYREVREPVAGRSATVLLYDVPLGAVAVVAFHDEDGDGRLRRDEIERPLDGVAVPNWTGEAPPVFGASALRVVPDGVAVVRLRLRYPADERAPPRRPGDVRRGDSGR